MKGFLIYLFILITLIFSFFCYIRIDPIKRCLFLVLSLLSISPVLSFGLQIWFRYFVCLIFLSGIFVILVYFSSLSKYNFFKFSFSLLIFIGFFFVPFFFFYGQINFLFSLYFINFFYLFLHIIFFLLFFINFTSYFLNFSGALRKI